MSELATRTCVPCRGGIPALKGTALEKLRAELGAGWEIVSEHHLQKEFLFPNFRTALGFTNRVGEVAEAQDHHPDIYLAWGKVQIQIWTHKIDGLHENDFILASKIDNIPVQ